MMAIIDYFAEHWIEGMFTLLTACVGYLIKRLHAQRKEYKAIAEGVQSLLRESIVQNYNKYSDKGFCPIYAKESIKRVYKAYTALGGNDVAESLYKKILEKPEEGDKKDERLGKMVEGSGDPRRKDYSTDGGSDHRNVSNHE